MTAYVIMHNMIIENERGQELDYTHYDLIVVSIQVRRRQDILAQFISSYHAIRQGEMHDQLQLDIIEEWWKWHGQQ
jgi:hypothetical protein